MSKANFAFWDSSALVPLCAVQATTNAVERLAERYSVVVWWGTSVELQSAFARLHRSAKLNEGDKELAIEAARLLSRRWEEILPSDELREIASSLLYSYPLRAADGLQLAAAMIWCRQKPTGRNFISSDARLCEAASQAGFFVNRVTA